MKKKWIRAAAAFVLAAAVTVSPAFAVTIGGARVTGDNVRLRTGIDTSTNANVLVEMPRDAFLLVEENLGAWYKVVYNGMEGYVSSAFASFSENAEGTYGYQSVTGGTDINMRASATTASPIVRILRDEGTSLTVTGVSGQWLEVTDAAGASGYVRSDLLKYKPTTAAGSAATQTLSAGDKLAQTAMLYKGYAYVWGGMSPLTGFDCSGLCYYVCAQHGITLHRVAQDQYSYDGVPVAKGDLQPGDLLFFGYGPYSVGHVGMYIGNNQMIHASTYTTGVIISDFDSTYYTNNFVGAKRVV